MLRSSDSLTLENSLNAFESEEILQALAVAGLLSQEKLYLELTNEAVNFARKEKFSFSQLCALVSIINRVLKELSNSPYDDIQNVLDVSDKIMMSYSIQRPPHCIELFSIADSLKCVEFLVDSLFRHWRLYKFALAPTARLLPQLIYDTKVLICYLQILPIIKVWSFTRRSVSCVLCIKILEYRLKFY
ncbi:unnamed protein product [Schistosoma mattheei]|uniref:Ras-GEF domain-containing protein n=1 Tax=Schistosoma mattheei TaxID=31246 RepID=A0AA85B838_9TREM|nr:unnamed protein product [Schistosoma mattheei]